MSYPSPNNIQDQRTESKSHFFFLGMRWKLTYFNIFKNPDTTDWPTTESLLEIEFNTPKCGIQV